MHIKKLIWAEERKQFLKLAELYCQIWKDPPWNEDFWTVNDVMKDMEEQSLKPQAIILAATNGSMEMIGFTWGYETNISGLADISGISADLWKDVIGKRTPFYIDELGVAREKRGHGIGKNLVKKLLSEISLINIDCITLRTDMAAMPARKIYSAAGFQELQLRDAKHKNRTYWLKNLR